MNSNLDETERNYGVIVGALSAAGKSSVCT